MNPLKNKNVLIGITGGIAAFKVPEVVRELQRRGANVTVVLTENGKRFVSEYTLKVLTSGRCYSDMFGEGIPHIDLARWADLIAILPASYNTIGKIASGIADNLLTTLVSATETPVVLFPAMNSVMYENPVHRRNLKVLEEMGYIIAEPEEGLLACGESGPGRLPSPESIILFMEKALSDNAFTGKKVTITAGGTEEPIDPVRVITNKSTGRMGVELARAFFLRGADVTVIHGRTSVYIPDVYRKIPTITTEEMFNVLKEIVPESDILVMAAAVSDFVPEFSQNKIKRQNSLTLNLKPTMDILSTISSKWTDKIYVGFCLEDERTLLESARKKMEEKGCHIIVANSLSSIGSENIRGYIITPEKEEDFDTSKEELAWKITDTVLQLII